MNPDPNPAKAIFLEAVEQHAPDQWPAFLDQACGGDAELRARVKQLLSAHQEVGSLPGGAAAAATATFATAPPGEGPGTMIGPYKLLEPIGEGGFGVVYMAEQTQPVRRKVALKVLKPGMDTRHVVARFEAERQALALMDHPNIAKVHDGGVTPSGRPYFVMELVKGVPITDFCDQNNLTPRERLELFVSACGAVQHAHQKGIIHRDLKPSNVLVAVYDGTPLVKIIDFGIAKALGQELTDKTLFTGFAQMIGTPQYMSPEQAGRGLDIDTRSDIYSLGVLLYELLTGSTPFIKKRFQHAAYEEIRRMIREEEPPKPSTRLSESKDSLASISAQRHTEPARLTKLVRGELDWIVMKALEKDRNRRYETVNGLAVDIGRYMHDEPVVAGPPSAGYRLRKFLRRNKVPALVAMVVLLVLTGGIVGTTWGLLRAVRERDEKELARRAAQENFLQAKKAVDDYFTKVSESTLLDKPGLQPLRKELLESALKYYQELLRNKRNDPGLQAEIAATYLRMFMIYLTFGSGDEAYAALQTGLEIVERLVQNNPNDSELPQPLAGFWGVERFLYTGPQSSPKLSNPLQAYRTLQKAAGTWEKLAHDHPTVPGFQNDLAAFSTYIGDHFWDSGRPADALHAYEKAAEIREKLNRTKSDSREYRAALGESRNGLAWMLHQNGRRPDAEHAYRQALDLLDQLVGEFPEVPHYRWQLASCLANLGQLLQQTHRPEEAEQRIRRALRIREKLVAGFPDVPAYEAEVARTYGNLGDALSAAGRADEAENIFRRGIGLFEKLIARFSDQPEYRKEVGWIYCGLAGLMESISRPNDAENAYRAACLQWEKFVADFPDRILYRRRLVQLWIKRVKILKAAGKPQDAEKVYRHAMEYLATFEAVQLKNSGFEADSFECFFLAISHWQVGEKEKARAYYKRAVVWMDRKKPDDEELHRFRDEAAAALRIKEQSKSKAM